MYTIFAFVISEKMSKWVQSGTFVLSFAYCKARSQNYASDGESELACNGGRQGLKAFSTLEKKYFRFFKLNFIQKR